MLSNDTAPGKIRSARTGVCFGCIALFLAGCSMTGPKLTAPTEAYRRALEETDHGGTSPLTPEQRDEAIARVMALFEDYSEENLRRNIREVYAENLFFRDGFKEFSQVGPLEDYMIHSTEPLRTCTFDFEPAVVSGQDVFLRWTMNLNLKRDKVTEVDRAIGMSHLRFDAQGKVVFQQDYWDPTDVLYRRIPVANWLIGKVKARL